MSTTLQSPMQSVVSQLASTAKIWKAEGTIDGDEVALAQHIVSLYDLSRKYRPSADKAAMLYELGQACQAFLAKDFPGAKAHCEQAKKWYESMKQP